MTRYGAQFGPDITFLGIPAIDVDDSKALEAADIVIVGAPFDGGTSFRAGARLGPSAIRGTDYLPHDGSRPSLALRTDGLKDLNFRLIDWARTSNASTDRIWCLPRRSIHSNWFTGILA